MKREPTRFESRVYDALCRVPVGKVVTYKTLGLEVGCHRVIPATFKLGGFQGEVTGASIEKKRQLLKEEGVIFDDQGNLIDPVCVLDQIPE